MKSQNMLGKRGERLKNSVAAANSPGKPQKANIAESA
jgi:hypothetical protein